MDYLVEFVKSLLSRAAVLGLSFGLVYTVFSNLRKAYRITFEEDGFSGFNLTPKDNLICAKAVFTGTLKNPSTDPNTLTKVYLVVWRNSRRNSTLRFGFGGVSIRDVNTDEDLKLPLRLEPREARALEISVEFPATGTADQKILQDFNKPIAYVFKNRLTAWLHGLLCKQRITRYELAFEDVRENLFDKFGRLRNETEISLWWTLPNYKGLKRAQHFARIYIAKVTFWFKNLLKSLGIFA